MPKETKTGKPDIDKQQDYSSEKRLLGYFWKYWYLLAVGVICSAGIARIQLWFFDLIKNIVNIVARADNGDLARTCLLIVVVHLIKWILSFAQTYSISAATQKIAIQLRIDLYAHLNRLSLSYFERTKVGHLMSRMTNDVGLVQSSAPHIVHLISAPMVFIYTTYYLFKINWQLALISLVALPAIAYSIARISNGLRSLTRALQVQLADVAAVVQETLSAVRIVKSFSMEDFENDRFADENQRTYHAAMRTVKITSAVSPTVEFIGIVGIAIVLWIGGNMAHTHSVPGFRIGELVAFLTALNVIASSAREVAKLNVTYSQIMAGAQRVFDILEICPDIADAKDATELPPVTGSVEFKEVVFSYDGKDNVLNDISFSAEPGQTVAIVGPSGAGKSTISNLIPRLYDVSSGTVSIDGIDVRTVTLKSLRQQIAIVPQDTILFSTSIRENIAYGRMEAAAEDIIAASKAANAHHFIERLPEGYDTLVGERGVRLSGGERQRVAIARALLKDPKILVLDEATSSLDVASEAVVQEALNRLMEKRTTLVIAHRLSTIIGADKILVMQGGRIAESGTHHELIEKGGLYAELYAIQNKTTSETEYGSKK